MNQKQIIYNKETHNTGFETSPALTANTRHTPDYSLRTKGTKPTSADVPPKPDRLKDNNQSESLGKLVPLFFYRDRSLSERLALSVGMFTRGEVGAGVIFIALGYNLGGPALIVSVLTLVLNLILTGGFVVWVKRLALKSYTPEKS